jgi:hypothetical protein
MIDMIDNYKPEARMTAKLLQAEGVSQGEIHRRLLSVYFQKVFGPKEMTAWRNKLKMMNPEKHRGRSRTSRTDENCVVVEGKIKESNQNS